MYIYNLMNDSSYIVINIAYVSTYAHIVCMDLPVIFETPSFNSQAG